MKGQDRESRNRDSFQDVEGVVISNGKVTINGKLVKEVPKNTPIVIKISGDVNGSIKTDSGDIHVEGSVKGPINTMSGDIEVLGDITGHCSTVSGDITADSIEGNCSTVSGDIDAFY